MKGLYVTRLPYTMTNRGLQISARLRKTPNQDATIMILNCHRLSDRRCLLALILKPWDHDYVRAGCTELTRQVENSFIHSKQPSLELVHIKRRQLIFGSLSLPASMAKEARTSLNH